MTTDKRHLPLKISEFIKEHFRKDFLFEVKEVRHQRGQWLYTVMVSKDNHIQTLTFNENGKVLNDEDEEAFPEDIDR